MKKISIGDNVSINRGTELYTSLNINCNIIIKDNVVISPNVKFYGAGHDYKYLDIPDTAGNIIIEKDVWICANSIILQGITIGEGCVISANSVVTKDFPPYSIVAGIPAKIIKSRNISIR
ncbi:MAG: acyltransferase [Spirochaetaceae bacterium]